MKTLLQLPYFFLFVLSLFLPFLGFNPPVFVATITISVFGDINMNGGWIFFADEIPTPASRLWSRSVPASWLEISKHQNFIGVVCEDASSRMLSATVHRRNFSAFNAVLPFPLNGNGPGTSGASSELV